MIDDAGNVHYRGYTLVVSDIQVHCWHGPEFIETFHGPPHVALLRARDQINEWMVAR